jgi:RNA polymerase sigma factor (sigma-70 family)
VLRVFLAERRTAWSRRVDLAEQFSADRGALDADTTTRVVVRQALAVVPPRQRAALVLRFFCDLSVDETAKIMQCTAGTVKSTTARGLEALRRALEPTYLIADRKELDRG